MSGLIAQGDESLSRPTAWLVPLSGPPLDAVELLAAPGGVVLGRGDPAQIKLPLSADKVSRAHCRFFCVEGTWSVSDLSRWGTFVNGVRLAAGQRVGLREGDTIRVVPWTFGFSAFPPRDRGQELADDTASTTDIRSVEDASARQLAGNLSDILSGSTELIHAARSERELAEVLMEVALRGTGMMNAAVLKVIDGLGRVEVLASRLSPGAAGQQLYSRSLVARARQGQVAELRVDAMSGNVGESVMNMKISAAICAPLMIGDGTSPAGERDVAALLYLDSRVAPGLSAGRPQANAAGFVMALARIGSLALANLHRMEMAIRVKETQHDLEAAAEAQRLIFPPREGRVGGFSYRGETRPGTVGGGGDFFDVIPVGPHKLAVALGDVTGKGIPASVLMTASFGYLHSLLQSGHDVATAAKMLTSFLHPRRPSSRFVTLWVGVFDLERKELQYVDCGHGWAALCHADGTFESLDCGGGLPCGIEDEWDYQAVTIPLRSGSRALVVSDGLIEQFGWIIDEAGKPVQEQFGMSGLKKTLGSVLGSDADELKSLYDAVVAYAGSQQLSDDATAIMVKWD
jgi:serine phosphatase RsbU (regulator of sigma subunit)